jgi:hypothetical protein
MSRMDRAGRIRLAKGYVMHKMRHLGYTSGRHTSIDNLPKSCPEELRPNVADAIRDLFVEGHLLKKSTEYGVQVTMIKSKAAFDYANLYCREYNLQEEEYGKPYRRTKVPPLPTQVLHALKLKKRQV